MVAFLQKQPRTRTIFYILELILVVEAKINGSTRHEFCIIPLDRNKVMEIVEVNSNTVVFVDVKGSHNTSTHT